MDDIKKQNPNEIFDRRKTISKGSYLEQKKDNNIFDYKLEISILKTIIHFQCKEIEELRGKIEKMISKNGLGEEIKSAVSNLDEKSVNKLNEEASQTHFVEEKTIGRNENKIKKDSINSEIQSKSKGESNLDFEKNKNDKLTVKYDIVSRVIKSGKGWSVFMLGLKLLSIKQQEALKYKDKNIFIQGGNFLKIFHLFFIAYIK